MDDTILIGRRLIEQVSRSWLVARQRAVHFQGVQNRAETLMGTGCSRRQKDTERAGTEPQGIASGTCNVK